jgi:hypothetical protein
LVQETNLSTQQLLEQSAVVIRGLSSDLEELKKENARLLREKHAQELTGNMIDSGILDADHRGEKMAELMKVSEEDFTTLQKAVSMLGNAPDLGIVVEDPDNVEDFSGQGEMYRVLHEKVTGGRS